MISTSFLLSSKRSLTQDVIPFLNNIIFQYTNTLSFEAEPHIIHTIPLAREHCDCYCHDLLPVGILHAAQELRALDEFAAEVIINTKIKLNFAKLN